MNVSLSYQTETMLQNILESVNGRQIINGTYALAPDAHIAKSLAIGGYLRDEFLRDMYDYELVSRDIDILVFSQDMNHIQAPRSWSKLSNTVRRPIKPVRGVIRQPSMFNYGKISKYTLSHIGYYKVPNVNLMVNLLHCDIGFTSPKELVEQLDFGINQIAYDGLQIYTSGLFWKDVQDETLTWRGKDTSGTARSHAEQRAKSLTKRLKLQSIWPEARNAE